MFGMHRTRFDHACLDLLSPVILSRVLTICHIKLTQRPAPEQKHFDLRLLSPALRNLYNLQTLFLHSSKQPTPVTDTCFVSSGCLITRASTYCLLFCHCHSFNPCLCCLSQIQLLYRCFKAIYPNRTLVS